mmetsp:Transcript_30959/g.81029  ORF Transcript_30959/g.81029 Transcript_30959/m.81029 type:complete len:208 (-) Transcript_30959:656-1279(-)
MHAAGGVGPRRDRLLRRVAICSGGGGWGTYELFSRPRSTIDARVHSAATDQITLDAFPPPSPYQSMPKRPEVMIWNDSTWAMMTALPWITLPAMMRKFAMDQQMPAATPDRLRTFQCRAGSGRPCIILATETIARRISVTPIAPMPKETSHDPKLSYASVTSLGQSFFLNEQLFSLATADLATVSTAYWLAAKTPQPTERTIPSTKR